MSCAFLLFFVFKNKIFLRWVKKFEQDIFFKYFTFDEKIKKNSGTLLNLKRHYVIR